MLGYAGSPLSLIKKEVLEDVGLFDESLTSFEIMILLRIIANYTILFLDRPLIKKYGGHADQLSWFEGIEQYRIQFVKILSMSILDQDQFLS